MLRMLKTSCILLKVLLLTKAAIASSLEDLKDLEASDIPVFEINDHNTLSNIEIVHDFSDSVAVRNEVGDIVDYAVGYDVARGTPRNSGANGGSGAAGPAVLGRAARAQSWDRTRTAHGARHQRATQTAGPIVDIAVQVVPATDPDRPRGGGLLRVSGLIGTGGTDSPSHNRRSGPRSPTRKQRRRAPTSTVSTPTITFPRTKKSKRIPTHHDDCASGACDGFHHFRTRGS